MNITNKWREWVASLSPQRLRNIRDDITLEKQLHNQLTEPDELLLKLCNQELETRYQK
jgi:hypothetical protein